MLASSELQELDAIRAFSIGCSFSALLREQDLRLLASKSQQLKIYGYWRKGSKRRPRVRGTCPLMHGMFDVCLVCVTHYASHEDHICPDGRTGRFEGCSR